MLSRRSGGFTLVEVLIAVLIFSLSLLALVPLLSTAASIDRENYLNVMARALAADTLDSLMALDSLEPADVPVALSDPPDVTDQGVVIERLPVNIVRAGNVYTVSVRVRYSYKGQTKIFVLSSQRAR